MERLRVGDAECVTVKDDHFVKVRRALHVSDDFLDGTLDLRKLAGGGGKGGDLMTRTFDGRFFVKQLNGGDAKSLLRDDFLTSYVALVSKASRTHTHTHTHTTFSQMDKHSFLNDRAL